MENAALAISSFGAAKHTMSDAYYFKAVRLNEKKSQARLTASEPEFETLLLQAVKYNDRNVPALLKLSRFYLDDYQRSQNRAALEKGRPYLLQAAKVDSKARGVSALMFAYKIADTVVKK